MYFIRASICQQNKYLSFTYLQATAISTMLPLNASLEAMVFVLLYHVLQPAKNKKIQQLTYRKKLNSTSFRRLHLSANIVPLKIVDLTKDKLENMDVSLTFCHHFQRATVTQRLNRFLISGYQIKDVDIVFLLIPHGLP